MQKDIPNLIYIVTILSLIILPKVALTEEDSRSVQELEKIKQRIVKIKSNSAGTCGSGVIIDDNRILTTAHLTDICEDKKCDNLAIIDQSGKEQQINGAIKITYRFLDLAILTTDKSYQYRASPLVFQEANEQLENQIISFPNCQNLRITSGKLINKHPFIESSALGSFGSSGGLIIQKQRSGDMFAVGIVTEGSSIVNNIIASVLKSDFPLAGVSPRPIIADNEKGVIRQTSDAFINYYEQNITDLNSLYRIYAGGRFYRNITDLNEFGVARGVLPPEYTNILHKTLVPFVSSLKSTPADSIYQNLLIIGYLEENGPEVLPLRYLDAKSLLKILKPIDLLINEKLITSKKVGNKALKLALIVSCCLILLLTAILYGITITYTYFKCIKKSSLRRWVLTILVAVCIWPVSFLVFWLFFKRSASSAPAERLSPHQKVKQN